MGEPGCCPGRGRRCQRSVSRVALRREKVVCPFGGERTQVQLCRWADTVGLRSHGAWWGEPGHPWLCERCRAQFAQTTIAHSNLVTLALRVGIKNVQAVLAGEDLREHPARSPLNPGTDAAPREQPPSGQAQLKGSELGQLVERPKLSSASGTDRSARQHKGFRKYDSKGQNWRFVPVPLGSRSLPQPVTHRHSQSIPDGLDSAGAAASGTTMVMTRCSGGTASASSS